jgi:hypothetical protein
MGEVFSLTMNAAWLKEGGPNVERALLENP